MAEEDMKKLGLWITQALKKHEDEQALETMKVEVEALCRRFPVPGIAD